MEKQPEFGALIDLRLQYSPSTGPDGSKRSFEPVGDYSSGQRCLAVFKASGVPALAHQPLRRAHPVGVVARNGLQRQRHPVAHAVFQRVAEYVQVPAVTASTDRVLD